MKLNFNQKLLLSVELIILVIMGIYVNFLDESSSEPQNVYTTVNIYKE